MAEPGASAAVDEADGAVETRSPSDVLRLVVASALLLVLFLVERLFGETFTQFTTDLLSGLSAVPSWLLDAVVSLTRVGTSLFLLGGLVLAVLRGRWRLIVVAGVAVGLGVLLVVLLGPVDPTAGPKVVDLQGLVPSQFPTAAGVAAGASFATAAAPWLTRRWRRIAWVLVIGMTVSRFLVSPIAFDSIRGLAIGWWAGAAVLVALGAPTRRPSAVSIMRGLELAGVEMTSLERAGVDARGSTPYFGTTAGGRRLFVKALGVDERSADLLFRMYRALLPHNLGDERPFESLRRTVEHEALLALMANDLGVKTPPFVALAHAEPNAFVLAYEAIDGKSLDGVDVADLDDELLREVWSQVADLHRHRIAHRDLRLANVFRGTDGAVWLIDFGFSEAAASDLLLHTDRAELLASTATRVGAEGAVAAAVAVVGIEGLAGIEDRLRPWALSGATRAALKADRSLLPALKTELARVGVPAVSQASTARAAST
jgi:undecaprenyl-diphosphatase